MNAIQHETIKKSLLKTSIIVAVITALVIIVAALAPLYYIIKIKLKQEIDRELNCPKEALRVVATHNLLKKRVSYGLLLRQIQKIEGAMVYARRCGGQSVPRWTRLTLSEFEDHTTVLYIYQQTRALNVKGFSANTCAETAFNKRTVSHVGAKGICQLMRYTFNIINRQALFKYGDVDIFDVYHNTEAGVMYWLHSREYLKYVLKRSPTVAEIAMAYNAGANRAAWAIKTGTPKKYLPPETVRHGKKVNFYYKKILKEDFKKFMYGRR
jgi:hypothetical protein